MKRLRILYLLALTLLVIQTSCNKDDEAPAPNPMIGEWELYKVNVDFPGNSEDDGDYPATIFVDFYKVTFSTDNSFVEEISAGGPISNEAGEWTLTNKEVELNFDNGNRDSESYTLNEDNTLMTGEGFDVNFGTQTEPDIASVRFILRKDQ